MSIRLTYAEAAEILGVHVSAVPKIVRRGELHAERRRDGALLRSEVEELAAQRRARREELESRAGKRRQVDPRPDADHEWFRPREVAELVGISEQGVRKRLARGTMPAVRKGSRWWVRADQLANVERARLASKTRRP